MVTVLALLGVAAVLFVAAVLSTKEEPLLAEAPPDAADLSLPDGPLTGDDVAAVRLSVAPRGYRMAEVDLVLERLASELRERDEQLARLTAEPAAADEPPRPVTLRKAVDEEQPAADRPAAT